MSIDLTKKPELRPIGTEFAVDFPPSPCSNNPNGHRYHYRVIDHVDAFLAGPGSPTIRRERIELFKIEELPPENGMRKYEH